MLTVKNQNYCLASIIESKDDRPHIFTVLGCFSTVEEAKEHAKMASEEDNSHNIFLCEVGKWVPVPASEEFIENTEYQDRYVQELMTGYMQSQIDAKKHFEERKKEMLENPAKVEAIPEDAEPRTLAIDTE